MKKPSFTLLRDPNLQQLAAQAMRHCRSENANLGSAQIERAISASVRWVPTFRFGSSAKGIRAYEVCRTLQPDALIASLPHIVREPYPISVGIVVPVELAQGPGTHREIEALHQNGVSVITADDANHFHNRLVCPPAAQHITPDDWRTLVMGLPPRFRSAFLAAYTTYQASVVQGVQNAGQIVEAVVNAAVAKAISDGVLPATTSRLTMARKIDVLWSAYPRHRGNLAAARVFADRYRNPSSHPPSSTQSAVSRIMRARAAMQEAVVTTVELLEFLKALPVAHNTVHLP